VAIAACRQVWLHARSRQELIDAVHDNLRNLGLDRLDVVNLRVGGVMGPSEGSIEEPLTVLAELKRQDDSSSGCEQRQSRAVGGGSENYGDRLLAELLHVAQR